MKRLLPKVCVLAGVWAVARTAGAEGPSFYAGASVARAGYDVHATSPLTDASDRFGGHDTGFQVEAGVRVAPFLGFELSYADFGSFSGQANFATIEISPLPPGLYPQTESVHAHLHTTSGYAVGSIPLGRWDLFAKLGGSYWYSPRVFTATVIAPGVGTCTITDPNCALRTMVANQHDHGWAATYGAGTAVHFGRLAVRAEYERFEIGRNTNLASIGATWKFF